MPHLAYALLVGINKYHPASGISRLYGCHNDVFRMKDYLKRRFGEKISIKTLMDRGGHGADGPATRAAVIHHFENHLGQAQAGEIALFCFSGHGSTEKAPVEISAYKGNALNETLVCYDSRVDGVFDLADIELRYLISRVAQNGAEVIVILDSCFAGSATRYGARFRTTSASKVVRPFETYLEAARRPITDPRHILLAACRKDELAAEHKLSKKQHHGLFTHTLLTLLEQKNNPPAYNRLINECAVSIAKILSDNPHARQTPVLDVSGDFYPFNYFLDPTNHFDQYHHFRIRSLKGTWIVDFGFMNGQPTYMQLPARFAVFEDRNLEMEILEAETQSIYLDKSVLKNSEELNNLDPLKTYTAIPVELPHEPLVVQVSDTDHLLEQDLNELRKPDQKKLKALISFAEEQDVSALYQLQLAQDQYSLRFKETGEGLHPDAFQRQINADAYRGKPRSNSKQLCILLEHISRWEQLYQLNLSLQESTLASSIEQFPFQFAIFDKKGEVLPFSSNAHDFITEITLDFPGEWINNDFNLIEYILSARNPYPGTLYFYLVYLSRRFGIEVWFHEDVDEDSPMINLLKKERFGLGLPQGLNQSTDIFKLIVSRTELFHFNLAQPSIDLLFTDIRNKYRDVSGLSESDITKKSPFDWFTKTISVKLLRELGRITYSDLLIAYQKIRIKGHPYFRAAVSLASSARKMRTPKVDFIIADLAVNLGLELLDFSSSRRKETILEIHHMENLETLADKPLEIFLQVELKANEKVVPVTLPANIYNQHINQNVVMVGSVEKLEKSGISVRISHIPGNPSDGRLESGRSLKISFFKVNEEGFDRLRKYL